MTAAPETLTWDIPLAEGGPRRPSLADVGGATVEERGRPDRSRMLYADQVNQWAKQIAALGKVVFTCAISVEFGPNGPAVVAVLAAGTNVRAESFQITPEGPGQTLITWPAGTLPPPALKPEASIDSDGAFAAPVARLVQGGVRVKTWTTAGVPASADFTVKLF